MNHKGTITIETGRLVLRQFRRCDAQAMFNNWAGDDEVTKYLTWPTHSDVSITQMIIGTWVNHYDESNYYQWAIAFKDNAEMPIGSISVVEINELLGNIEIGYCIGKKWWNKGVVTEAMKALIEFFFETVGAEKVCARHDVLNPASGRVMQKCGMKYEGTIRRNLLCKERACDITSYSILKDEYFNNKGES